MLPAISKKNSVPYTEIAKQKNLAIMALVRALSILIVFFQQDKATNSHTVKLDKAVSWSDGSPIDFFMIIFWQLKTEAPKNFERD
jgi:hypothetical protein